MVQLLRWKWKESEEFCFFCKVKMREILKTRNILKKLIYNEVILVLFFNQNSNFISIICYDI